MIAHWRRLRPDLSAVFGYQSLYRWLLVAVLSASVIGPFAIPAWSQKPIDSPSIRQWKAQLQSADVLVRRKAATQTRSLDAESLRELLPTFVQRLRSDHDGQVRLAMLNTLTDMGPAADAAVDVLVYSMRTDFGGRHNEEIHQDYRAALALAAIGKPAVPKLRRLLTDESAHLRAEAAMALGRIGPDAIAAIDDLIVLLSDAEKRVRRDAIAALGNIGIAAIEPLAIAAGGKDLIVRAGAIEALGPIAGTDPQSDALTRRVAVIRAAINDDEPLVRVAGMQSIRSIMLDEPSRRDCLLQNLQHDDPRVRIAVINVVVGQTELLKQMQPELIRMLIGPSDGVAGHAAFLLQELGPDATSLLLAAASNPSSRIDQIGESLARIGTAAVERLSDAITDADPRVRQAAATALGKIRPASSQTVELLAAGLEDPNEATQAACLRAIGKLGRKGADAVPAVRAKLRDRSADIRQQAIGILVQAAPRDIALVDDLTMMIGDPDADIQRQAMDAVRSLGPIGRRSLPTVIDKLSSPAKDVRLAAAALVGSHGAAAGIALPTLTGQLSEADTEWRLNVIGTIGKLGSAARPALAKLVALLDDPDATVRADAMEAISNLGLEPKVMLPLLAKTLSDHEPVVSDKALRVTRKLGRSANLLVPDIIPHAANEEQRRSVSRVLERLEKYGTAPESISALIELLASKDKEVRRLALRFLGLAGPAAAEAIPPMQRLLEDPDAEVRDEAATAITRIRDTKLGE